MWRQLAAWLFTCAMASAALADVPDARQDCRQRNAALCRAGGVDFVNDGPCPPEAITLRPPGNAQCDEAYPRDRPNFRPERPDRPDEKSAPARRPASPQGASAPAAPADWRMPAILFAALLLTFGGFGWLLRTLLRKQRARLRRFGLNDLATLTASGIGGFWIAWRLTGWAFTRIVEQYHNADTIAPALIGSLGALIVFLLALPVAFALIALILFNVQERLRK